jgi:hypothetical protein
VPFEEDDKDPSIWFLDHSYLEVMFRMFKKVNGELWQPQQQWKQRQPVWPPCEAIWKFNSEQRWHQQQQQLAAAAL